MSNLSNKAAVVGRIVATGTLKVMSPLLIASGGEKYAEHDRADKTVLCDKNGVPYIPATSIAGVLKHFSDNDNTKNVAQLLFGSEATDKEGIQSSFIFRDIVLDKYEIISRDGVCIDDYTGVAVDGKKFDFELVNRGARGSFKLEMVLRRCHVDEDGKIKDDLRNGLDRFFKKLAGGFSLGAGTAKGLGNVKIDGLYVDHYDFTNKKDVAAWLSPQGHKPAVNRYPVESDSGIYPASDFVVEAEFALPNSLLVRDYDLIKRGEVEKKIKAKDEGSKTSVSAISLKDGSEYVVPGSSLKGALRKHAVYIVDRLQKSQDIVHQMMGPSPDYMEEHKAEKVNKWKSRFMVDEVYIKASDVKPVVQVRNSIDRFTGGTIQSRLFATQGIYGRDAGKAVINMRLTLESAQEHEIGLMLFILRDLWQGKVALGGEKSIGRGTLKGISARMYFDNKEYVLKDKFSPETMNDLELYAMALAMYPEEDK